MKILKRIQENSFKMSMKLLTKLWPLYYFLYNFKSKDCIEFYIKLILKEAKLMTKFASLHNHNNNNAYVNIKANLYINILDYY